MCHTYCISFNTVSPFPDKSILNTICTIWLCNITMSIFQHCLKKMIPHPNNIYAFSQQEFAFQDSEKEGLFVVCECNIHCNDSVFFCFFALFYQDYLACLITLIDVLYTSKCGNDKIARLCNHFWILQTPSNISGISSTLLIELWICV